MKKIISLMTVIAVVCCCVTGAFAFDTTTSNRMTADEETGLYTVSLSDLTSQYATVLAVKGTTISVGSIQYINQTNVSDGAATFSFALNESRMEAVTDTDDVYVLVGGGASSSTYGVIKGEEDAPATFTISGTVSGNLGSDFPVVTVLKGEEVIKTESANADGSFAISVSTLEEGTYSVKVAKEGYLSYTKQNISAETTGISAVLKAGDMNASGTVTMDDISPMLARFNANKTENPDSYVALYDLNGSETITMDDISPALANFNGTATIE